MITNYYYDNQIKKYLVQFMAIFAGMGVSVGKSAEADERVIAVPVHYGSKDRVSAAIQAENTQNKPIRVPAMSAYMNSIDMAPELRKGIGAIKRQTYLPRGGVIPDDITTVRQLMPVPYKCVTELAIYTSNMDQHLQILEQILMLFDPQLQIQKSDDAFDWAKITTVSLSNITFDENYPAGNDGRIITSTLSFEYTVYLSAPSNMKDDYVKDLIIRIDAVNGIDVSDSVQEQIYANDVLANIFIDGDNFKS